MALLCLTYLSQTYKQVFEIDMQSVVKINGYSVQQMTYILDI